MHRIDITNLNLSKHFHKWKVVKQEGKESQWICRDDDCKQTRTTFSEPLPL